MASARLHGRKRSFVKVLSCYSIPSEGGWELLQVTKINQLLGASWVPIELAIALRRMIGFFFVQLNVLEDPVNCLDNPSPR